MYKPSISTVLSLAKTITRANTIARCYKLEYRCPEITNYDITYREYESSIKRLEDFMRHPYIVSKSQKHYTNK